MTRQRIRFSTEIPLLIWLVIVWGALWRDFGLGNLAFGAIIAIVVVHVFYLPPVQLGGRFNGFQFFIAVGEFLVNVVKASFSVIGLSITQGRTVTSSVVAVHLRTHSDLILTATANVTALIPGSVVVEVDRANSTLYLHSIDVRNEKDADEIRRAVRATEARLIKVMGSRQELNALREDEKTGIGAAQS